MFEKDLNISYLLDFYGDILPEKKRDVLTLYYNEDFSLSEIAEQIGISRQGVRDIIKKAEEELFFFEEKLGLAKKFSKMRKDADVLLSLSQKEQASFSKPLLDAIATLYDDIS